MKILYTLFAIFVICLYIPLNKRKSKYYFESFLDKKIPLIPFFILPYLLYFIYIISSIVFFFQTEHYVKFLQMIIVSSFINYFVWILFPNGSRRQEVKNKDFFSRLLIFIRKLDNDSNACPSMHISLTMITSFFYIMIFPSLSYLFIIITILITVSVLFTKQHYIVDVLGGIISSYLAYLIFFL